MDGAVEAGTRPREAIIARESELDRLAAFIDSDRQSAVIVGGPGIGKTTLWEAGLELGQERGPRVLRARPSDAEAQLSFAALADLFQDLDTAMLAELPSPQLRALEVALLRAEPTKTPTDPRAVALGLYNALRSLAERQPLLVAVDDVQWLDSASGEALTFAARRLTGSSVRFLLARRPEPVSPLEQALERSDVERLELGPLSFGAARRLLVERLDLTPQRWVLRRVFETTGGNPLFLLEVGRTLAARGRIQIGEDIPVPEGVEDLLGTRVASLPATVRRLLLAVALGGELRRSEVASLADAAVLEEAVDSGVLTVDADRVRASHPLLAAAARKRSRSEARRELHLQLARVAADKHVRARHLALATTRPDEQVAQTIAAAAAAASARGAWQEAVELGEHALRLTPAGSPLRGEWILALADSLVLIGETQRATEVLSPVLDLLPAGAVRARGLLILATGIVTSVDDLERLFERTLAESRSDPGLHATVLARLASNRAALQVVRIAEAEALAEEALPEARRAGRSVEHLVLDSLSWTRILRGRPVDDLWQRYRAISDAASYIIGSPERARAQRHAWRGEIVDARALLTRLESLADERGESVSYAVIRLHLCELELRAGELEEAALPLQEWAESSERELLRTQHQRCLALLAAARGATEEAERLAAKALVLADESGNQWDRLEAFRASGAASLLTHEPARAAESLRSVWEHARREGVDDPGAFPVGPDLVEALVEVGELQEARAVTDRLQALAEAQDHPWGRASAKRCAALIRLASRTYEADAAASLTEAAERYVELGLRFDGSRSLLSLGRALRRHRKWGAARDALEQAAAAFDRIGSPGWAAEARVNLARTGGRKRRASGELTPSERRIAELAAAGRSNKEIARELYVGVHTVEVHLSHAYAKLGIHSRNQLAANLGHEP